MRAVDAAHLHPAGGHELLDPIYRHVHLRPLPEPAGFKRGQSVIFTLVFADVVVRNREVLGGGHQRSELFTMY